MISQLILSDKIIKGGEISEILVVPNGQIDILRAKFIRRVVFLAEVSEVFGTELHEWVKRLVKNWI